MNIVRLDLQPSIALGALWVMVSVLAIFGVTVLPILSFYHIVLVLLMIVFTGYYLLRDALLRLPSSIVQIQLNEKAECYWLRKDGRLMEITLSKECLVHPWCTVLSQQSRWRQALVITPDRVDAEAYRKLRILLLWAQPKTIQIIS